jgi:GST-like protein
MIDLYYWPTPNGWKISIMLEEIEHPYRVIPVNLRAGEQGRAEYAAINPNRKIPAIVDHDGPGGEVTVFESGAILVYLAEKTGKLLPRSGPARYEVLSWLMWQMGGLGPTNGHTKHFRDFAPGKSEYAMERFVAETQRLYGVMNSQLESRPFLAGELSIADIACWPFILPYERQHGTLDEFPALSRWAESMLQRPGVRRGLDVGRELRVGGPLDAHVKHLLSKQ